jgi:AcrR family transcriptional regulator
VVDQVKQADIWAEWPAATPRRILEAALESFAERGFHGTTIKHIAEGSGLSTAALYVHFAAKEEVLFALSRTGHAMALATVEAAADPDPIAALAELARSFVRWHAEHRTLARVVQYERDALTPEHRAVIAELRRQTQDAVRALIERGIAAGAVTVPDVHSATAAVLSLGIDVARWYRLGGRWTPDELAEHYSGLVVRMLAGRVGTP